MDYKEVAKQLGSRGGEKTKERHGVEHFKRISKLGAEARAKRKLTQFDIETDIV